jgi:hypothetical protein
VSQFTGEGKSTIAFSFESKTGSVGVRASGLGLAVPQRGWQISTDAQSLSISYGETESIRFDADGTVHFLGAVHFHKEVQDLSPVVPVQSAPLNELEHKEHQLGTSMSFAMGAEPTTEDPEDELTATGVFDLPDRVSLLQEEISEEGVGMGTRVDGGARWQTAGSTLGVRIDSQNSVEPKDAYLELPVSRNQAWGLGIRTDYRLDIGYGSLGSLRDNTKCMALSFENVEVLANAVFHQAPKYNSATARKLSLDDIPNNQKPVLLPHASESLDEPVPAVPQVTNSSIASAGSAEPIVAYSSNVEIKATSEVFLELRNQMQNRWLVRARKDQKLSFSYEGEGAGGTERTPLVLHQDGSIHFLERALFKGSTTMFKIEL